MFDFGVWNPDIREETGQDGYGGGGIIEIIDRRKGEPPWVTIDVQSGSQIFQGFGKPPNLVRFTLYLPVRISQLSLHSASNWVDAWFSRCANVR